MADARITDLADGGYPQSTDEFVVARAGANYKIAGSKIGPVKIFDSILGADAASIDTGAGAIPAGFSELEIVFIGRTTSAGTSGGDIAVRVNGDSGANYDFEDLFANAGAVTAAAVSAQTRWQLVNAMASATANVASTIRLTIPGYDGTTWEKDGFADYTVVDRAGTANFWSGRYAVHWRSTAAITRVAVSAINGGNIKAGSRLIVRLLP